MATKKKTRRSPSKKKRSAKRKKVVRRKPVVRKKSRKKVTRKKSSVAHLKKRVRDAADDRLKEGLYRRDKATTFKQHKAAQRVIDMARKDLRSYK